MTKENGECMRETQRQTTASKRSREIVACAIAGLLEWMMIRRMQALVVFTLAAPFASAQADGCNSYDDKCTRGQAEAACHSREERRKVCLLYDSCPMQFGNRDVPAGYFRACYIRDEAANFSGMIDFFFHEGGELEPEKNRGQPKCGDTCFADPVNATTGNKFETRTEFIAPGIFPLRLEWTYNASGTSRAATAEDLIFGRNRSHFYGRRVVRTVEQGITTAMVSRPDGKTLRFYKGSDEAGWSSDGDDPARLDEYVDLNGASGYRLDDGKGVIEVYASNGRLERLLANSVEEHRVSYLEDGRIGRVEDRRGRRIEFDYLQGRVSQAHLPDGNAINFSYSPAGDLSDVRYADGAHTQYRYDEVAYSAASPGLGLLTAVLHDGQRYSSTTYNDRGMATSAHLGAGQDLYTFVYTWTNGVPVSFEVTLPDGSKKYGPVRLKKGAAVPDYMYTRPCTPFACEPPWKTYKYDANANPDTVNEGGTITDYDYNDRGLLVNKVEASNKPQAKRTEQTWWHGSHPVPTERRLLNNLGEVMARTTWTYNERGQELVRSEHDPGSGAIRTWKTTYCETSDIERGACPLLGLVVETDGPRTDLSDVTTYTYRQADHPGCQTAPSTCAWRKGDLWKITGPIGHVAETLTYDGAGRVLSVRDSNGVTTDFGYDARGRLTSRTTRASN